MPLRSRASAAPSGPAPPFWGGPRQRWRPGDRVDIHGPPVTMDASGWAGPRAVMSVGPARCKAAAKYRRAD
eukprot:15355-Pyramimonas_sp.AAC.1